MVAADVAADGPGERVRLELGAVAGAIVRAVMQRFGNDVSLERNVLCAARTRAFIRTPTDGTMVHDAIVATAQARAVHRFVCPIANAKTDVADDDIVGGVGARAIIRETNAIARGGLSGDGAIWVMDRARFLQMDQA